MESYAPLLDVYRWLGHCINAPNHIHMQICAHNKPTMLHSNFFYLCFVTMLHCLVHDFSRFFYELFKKCKFIINCVCVCCYCCYLNTKYPFASKIIAIYAHAQCTPNKAGKSFFSCRHSKRWWVKKPQNCTRIGCNFIYSLIVWRESEQKNVQNCITSSLCSLHQHTK